MKKTGPKIEEAPTDEDKKVSEGKKQSISHKVEENWRSAEQNDS